VHLKLLLWHNTRWGHLYYVYGQTFRMSERALVTGGCGFIGERFCEQLLDEGYDVRATDLESADRSSIEELDVEFVAADLTEPDDVEEAVDDVDVIFHTAAVFSYSSLLDWEVFERVNVDGTENLCEAAVEEGVGSIVHLSTAGVYGPPKEDLLPVAEDHPKNPESKYDTSKWLQEKKVTEYDGEGGMEVKVIRPAPVYGPGNTYGMAQIILGVGRGYLRFYPLFCDYRFAMVHVEDVVRAALHVHDEGDAGEAYNAVDESDATTARFIKDVAAMTGNRVYGLPIDCDTYERLSSLRYLVPPVERLFDVLNREPPVEADTFYYMKGNYWISNEKLKGTGFEFEHPTYRDGMPETVEWYEDEGML